MTNPLIEQPLSPEQIAKSARALYRFVQSIVIASAILLGWEIGAQISGFGELFK